jgi:hypothetical protein
LTYWSSITQESLQECDDAIDIPVLFHKPKTLAPRQIPDNVEGKELKPLAEAANRASICIQFLGLVEEYTDGGTDKRFVVDERAHGESTVNAAAIFGVVIFVGCGEERLQPVAFRYSILHGVKVGLLDGLAQGPSKRVVGTSLHHALVQSINNLDSPWIGKREDIGSQSHNVTVFSVEVDDSVLVVPSPNVPKPPPVRITRKPGPRIFV